MDFIVAFAEIAAEHILRQNGWPSDTTVTATAVCEFEDIEQGVLHHQVVIRARALARVTATLRVSLWSVAVQSKRTSLRIAISGHDGNDNRFEVLTADLEFGAEIFSNCQLTVTPPYDPASTDL